MVYQWKNGTNYRVSAQVVGERIEEIRIRRGGSLVPSDVVEDARRKKSPLHPLFIWDDVEAAGLYREQQARRVIVALVQVENEDDNERKKRTHQVFVGYGSRTEGSVFTTVIQAMSNVEIRNQVFSDVRRQIAGLQKRLAEFEEAAAAVAALGDAIDAIDGRFQPA